MTDDPPFARLGGLRLERLLAERSHSRLWVARAADGTRRVLKLHEPGPGERGGLGELRTLGLRHPGLAACVDSGRVAGDGRLYTVTDFVEGRALEPGALDADGLSAQAAELLAAELLAALDALHRGGLLHRDLKAENVQLDLATRRPVVLDFGLCCGLDEAAQVSLAGTPSAFAPELFGGEPASVASELWAAGMLLLEALAGRPVFKRGAPDVMATERRGFTGLSDDLRALVPSEELLRLLERLLAPDPGARPETAEAALYSLPLEDTSPGADLFRRQLQARWSVAFALIDPRRAAALEAAAGARVRVRLLESPGDSPARAQRRLAESFAAFGETDDAVARLLGTVRGSAGADVTRVVELASRLARRQPFIASLPRGAPESTATRLAQALHDVLGLSVELDEQPSAERVGPALESALGPQPVLLERLREATPGEWGALEEAVSELLHSGVLRAGRQGARLDEARLAASWPEVSGEDPALECSAVERAVLGLAVLSPRALSAAELAELLGHDVARELAALESRGFLWAGDAGSERRWSLVDGRTAQRLRAHLELPMSARRRLAATLGAAQAEELGADDAEAVAQVLLGAVEEPDDVDTSERLLAAAATLRRLGRLELAASVLQRGLDGLTASDVARRDLFELERLDVFIRRGDETAAESALAAARQRGSRHGGFDVRRARLLLLADRRDEALGLLDALPLDELDLETSVLALQLRAEVRRASGDPAGALVDLRDGLRRCGARPQRRAMVLLERLGGVLLQLGRFDEAVQTYERCLEMVRELGHEALIWSPMNNLARALQDRGERQRGLALQEQAAELCELAGDRRNLFNLVSSLGERWLQLGRLDRARVHLARALQLAQELNSPALEGLALHAEGSACAAEGRHDEAEQRFARALELKTTDADAIGGASVRLTRGACRLQRGDAAGARADLEAAQEVLGRVESPRQALSAELLATRLAWAEHDEAATIAAAERALSAAQELRQQRETIEARDLLARAGGRDLEDVDPVDHEATPWLARLLATRARRRAQAAHWEDSVEDFAQSLAILGESPDGGREAECLVLRLGCDLDRVAPLLEQPQPDIEAIGDILSRVPGDLARAEELLDSLDLNPLRHELETLRDRFTELEQGDDMTGLSALAGKLRDLERLVEINKLLNSERDTQKLLDLIIDSAVALTGAARGFLILFDGPAEEIRAARNIDASTIQHPEFQISHSVARRVAREGQPLLTPNAIDDPALGSAASISELKLLSILCAPLISRSRSLGAVYLDHPQVVGRFHEQHLETVTALAEQASIALENARLSEGLASSNDELSSSREEIRRLNEALEVRLQKREAELAETRESLDATQRALGLRYDYSNIITASPRMHEALDLLDRVTETDYPVVIQGESGTGKELMAHACHFNGPRAERNFLSLNCAAFPEGLIESELFGSKKGSFSGATEDRKGLFAQADGGTLFLDEIGDMSLGVQTRLLRVLQEGEFIPVGGREVVKVDVRVLCATHRDMVAMKESGEFREDLYYRLAVACVFLPPLRERPEDIGLLMAHFLERYDGGSRSIDPEALALLEAQSWPGNVRELENFVRNLLLFDREGTHISAVQVQRALSRAGAPVGSEAAGQAAGEAEIEDSGLSLKERLALYERAQVRAALKAAGGNKSAAARALGVTVRTLYKMLDRLSMQTD